MKKYILLIITLLMATTAYPAQWDKDYLVGTTLIPDLATNSGGTANPNPESLDRLLADYREGMKLKYSTAAALTVTAGQVMVENSDGSVRLMMELTSDGSVTWSDIDTGSEASSTTYYVYAIASSATATTATFKISTNSSAPTGVTYYKRLGQFTNDGSSNITVVKNDNENSIIATGTISSGSTISLPSGWSQDECDWTVGLGNVLPQAEAGPSGIIGAVEIDCDVSSSRVVTCRARVYDTNGTARTWVSGTANYIIACYR